MARGYTAYTDEQRGSIVTAAVEEGLTAREVMERFGVNAHTYYSWRRGQGLSNRGRRPARGADSPGAAGGGSERVREVLKQEP